MGIWGTPQDKADQEAAVLRKKNEKIQEMESLVDEYSSKVKIYKSQYILTKDYLLQVYRGMQYNHEQNQIEIYYFQEQDMIKNKTTYYRPNPSYPVDNVRFLQRSVEDIREGRMRFLELQSTWKDMGIELTGLIPAYTL